MVFTGQQPAREIPAFVAAATVLASPRIRGTNTPLKIYSYLRSGVPIVATNLLTHTQVLTAEVARLAPAEAAPFAAAIGGLLDDPAARRALAEAARRLSDAKLQPRGLPAPHRRSGPPAGRIAAAARRRPRPCRSPPTQ